MAVKADEVIVELEARNGRYNADIARSERVFTRSMRNIQGQASQTEARVTSAFRGMGAAMGLTLGAAGLALGARTFLSYVDAAKNLEAQLRLATRQTGNFAQAQEDVRRIARETRSDLSDVATLYATLQRNSRELGLTQQQVAQLTQTVTQTFLLSGASAAEAAGGLRQFIQGLQSGTLRGEEFNSVMENAPRLARALADELNVPIGQLRAMAEQGELTGQKVSTAVLAASATIQDEFDQLPVTFDQAMTLLDNAATETFGAFDRGGRFSEALINFITGGTDGMEDLAESAEQTGIEIRAAFEGLANAFDPLFQAGMSAFEALGIRSVALRDQIAALLGAFDQVQNLGGYGPRIQNRVRGWDMAIFGTSTLRELPGSNARGRFLEAFDASARRGQTDATARALGGGARDGRSVGPAEFQRFINEPGRYDLFGNPIGGAAPPRRVSAGGGGGRARRPRGGGESAETRANRQAREDERFDQEMAALRVDLLSAQQARTAAAEAVAQLEIQEIEATRDRQNAAYQADADQARDRKELAQARAQQLIEANIAVAAERVRAVELREAERVAREQQDIAAAGLNDAIDLERAQGSLARTSEERRDSALRLLEYSEEMERLELEGIIASREATEAQKEIARRRLEILDTLYAAEAQGVRDQSMSPGERYMRDIREVGNSINESLEGVAIDGLERLNDGLVEAIMGTKSLGEAFKQVAQQIIADLLRIAIQQAIIKPLAGALFGGGSLPGFATGGSMILGGRPGIDRNVLSINGQPIARVGRGETLSIAPQGPAASPAGQTIVNQTFVLDARQGITTPQLIDYVNQTARAEARTAGVAAYQRSIKDAPAAVTNARRFGTG